MVNIILWFKNIVAYRELIMSLVSKQIKVKYKHPFLGFLWALIVPLMLTLVFMVVFSIIIKVDIPHYPFFIFLITAVFPWNYFSLSLSESTMCILQGGDLIKKASFPREVIPISIVISNLINFNFTIIAIIIFLFIFRIKISIFVIFLPLIILVHTFFNIGMVLLVSGLQVRYRDIKFIVEVLLLLLFYLIPAFYPLLLVSNISEKFFKFYMMNPMAELITFYRLVLLPDYIYEIPSIVNINHLVITCIVLSFGFFYFGLTVFCRLSPKFVDHI